MTPFCCRGSSGRRDDASGAEVALRRTAGSSGTTATGLRRLAGERKEHSEELRNAFFLADIKATKFLL